MKKGHTKAESEDIFAKCKRVSLEEWKEEFEKEAIEKELTKSNDISESLENTSLDPADYFNLVRR